MRRIWDFHGGIHPPENKVQSLVYPIGNVPLPDTLVMPLNQHLGAPSEPLVHPGDKVRKGELIAAAAGFVSACTHASSSGLVVAIEPRPFTHPSGRSADSIVIQTDGDENWIERVPTVNYRDQSPVQVLALIRRAGIVGLGGAGFPTSVKLQPNSPVDTLIINATECEPYITADDALIRERGIDLITGIDIAAHVLGDPAHIIVGIEDNKAEAFGVLEPLLKGTNIELVKFPTKYPSGGEKQLIQILTGKEVPSGKLPAELGIVCHNVGTIYAIYRAVYCGEPMISRITTVTGGACNRAGNYEVLIGTPAKHLLATAKFDKIACERLVVGGPMMGYTISDQNAPVIKTTNCLLATTAQEEQGATIPQACIRCGYCAAVCPVQLLPQQLYWYAKAQDYEKLAAHNLSDCIECGACSYVCPSEIPLVQYYRAAKGEIRDLEQKQHIADLSRSRFEFHQQRTVRAAQERADKREARKLAALQAKQLPEDDRQTDRDMREQSREIDNPGAEQPEQANENQAPAKNSATETLPESAGRDS